MALSHELKGSPTMNLYDALSYFESYMPFGSSIADAPYVKRMADPAEEAAALEQMKDEPEYIHDAIMVLATFGRVCKRARQLSPAGRTLAGKSYLEFVFAAGGEIHYDKLWQQVWSRHRRTRAGSKRVYAQLVRDGVFVETYDRTGEQVEITVTFGTDVALANPTSER